MNISIAKSEDKDSIRKLWEYCFEDPKEYNDYYFENIFSPENTIVAKNKGKIIGSLQLRTYNMNFFSFKRKVALIVGISTLPEYRGQNIMHSIIMHTMKYLYKEDYSMVLLTARYPIIYKKYGFNYISSHKNYEFPLKNIPEVKLPKSIYIKRADEKDYNILAALYKNFQESRKIYFERDASIFKQLYEELVVENGNIYLIYKNNEAIGYFFSILSKSQIIIREFVYKDRFAIKALFSYLYYHQGQVYKASITAPKDEMFEELLNWDIDCDAFIKPFMLGRILNINKFIDIFKGSNISYNITDKIINSNSVIINQSNSENINLDISNISQLIFDYIDVETFRKYNQINCKNFNLLDKKITPFLNQYI
ncbi:MAG: enhanced intracellular survival protein Eis [Clostridia bacterium]